MGRSGGDFNAFQTNPKIAGQHLLYFGEKPLTHFSATVV